MAGIRSLLEKLSVALCAGHVLVETGFDFKSRSFIKKELSPGSSIFKRANLGVL